MTKGSEQRCGELPCRCPVTTCQRNKVYFSLRSYYNRIKYPRTMYLPALPSLGWVSRCYPSERNLIHRWPTLPPKACPPTLSYPHAPVSRQFQAASSPGNSHRPNPPDLVDPSAPASVHPRTSTAAEPKIVLKLRQGKIIISNLFLVCRGGSPLWTRASGPSLGCRMVVQTSHGEAT